MAVQCSFPLVYPDLDVSPMYLLITPLVLHSAHSIVYPILSVVQSGIVLDSFFGSDLLPFSLASSTSAANFSLLSQGTQSLLPQDYSEAQGFDLRDSNPIVGSPLSVNLTLGWLCSLENTSSADCNLEHSLL